MPGILISIGCIAYLAYALDFSSLADLHTRLHYEYVPLFLLFILLIFPLQGMRWRRLLHRRISVRHGNVASIISLGANMVLPARGGDLYRLYFCRKRTNLKPAALIGAMALEKAMDLIAAILLGSGAMLTLSLKGETGSSALFFSATLLAGLIVGLYILRFHKELLLRMIRPPFVRLKKDSFFKEHIAGPVRLLSENLRLKLFAAPFLLTMILWGVAYAGLYPSAGLITGVTINYAEALVLLFAGALSMAIPSAPSGLGLYHAALVSGFVLMGRSADEGLIFATVIHLLALVSYGLPALYFYLKHRGEMIEAQHKL